MSDAEQPEPPSQVVAPPTVAAAVTVPSATILMRPHLWLNWARISVRQERRAWDARDRGLCQPGSPGSYLGLETEESIEAVTAARHCLHNLWLVWNLGGDERTATLARLTTANPANAATWQTRVTRLVVDRNGVVHHNEATAPAQPHPVYPTNVSGLAASFTAERATEAVDILMDDVLRLVMTAPSPALQAFANDHGHVLALLDQQRSTGAVW
jgi:hypothetical protein